MGCVESEPKPGKRVNTPLPYKSKGDYVDKQLPQTNPQQQMEPRRNPESVIATRNMQIVEPVVRASSQLQQSSRSIRPAIQYEIPQRQQQTMHNSFRGSSEVVATNDVYVNMKEGTSRVSQQTSDRTANKSLQPISTDFSRDLATTTAPQQMPSQLPAKLLDPPIPVIKRRPESVRQSSVPNFVINDELVVPIPSLRFDIKIDIY